jgi:small nuclear ribonucleoprotein (snRNP)-like protein
MIFRRGLRRFLRRTMVVHTKDGRSFRGILVGEHADCIVLSHARLLDADVALGGEPVILRENISWCQDVTGMDREEAVDEVPASFEMSRGERP